MTAAMFLKMAMFSPEWSQWRSMPRQLAGEGGVLFRFVILLFILLVCLNLKLLGWALLSFPRLPAARINQIP